MTPIGVYDPFWIIDFFSRCTSWFWDKACNVLQKLFISNWLLDNPSVGWLMGDLDVETFCVRSFGMSWRWIGADTNSCKTSENHGRWGQRGAMRTILHWDWHILARTEGICLFVLKFYGPVNPMGSCWARSVYLTTCLLGRLSPLSGSPVLCTFFRQKLTTEGIRIVGGNAYAWRRFQFIENVSTTRAWLSGTGDTYNGSLWLNRVTNRIHIGIIEHLDYGIRILFW